MSFFARMPRKVMDDADKIKARCDADPAEKMWRLMAETFLLPHWPEFQAWWLRYHHERIEWMTFVLAPHNGIMFLYWVFHKHPETRQRAMGALRDVLAGERV